MFICHKSGHHRLWFGGRFCGKCEIVNGNKNNKGGSLQDVKQPRKRTDKFTSLVPLYKGTDEFTFFVSLSGRTYKFTSSVSLFKGIDKFAIFVFLS